MDDMNHPQQPQPQGQQQNQQQYSDQQFQLLLQTYRAQQYALQQSANNTTKTASSPTVPTMLFPIPNVPPSHTHASQQQSAQPMTPIMPVMPTMPITPIPPTSLPVTPLPALPTSPTSPNTPLLDTELVAVPKGKRRFTKIFAIALVIGLAVAIYFIWQPAPTTLSSSNSSIPNDAVSGGSGGSTTGDTGGDIQVYVLGAVKTPGIYTLPASARVFDLIKAAGGPLPKANLVALNMAAKLTDGEEVYVTLVGETPPTYMGGVPSLNGGNSTPVPTTRAGGTGGAGGATPGTGQLVNINTASTTDLMQYLHVSSKTAQSIVDYRTQNGNYTSVDQLLMVISRSIYDRIRSQCTV